MVPETPCSSVPAILSTCARMPAGLQDALAKAL